MMRIEHDALFFGLVFFDVIHSSDITYYYAASFFSYRNTILVFLATTLSSTHATQWLVQSVPYLFESIPSTLMINLRVHV
jgi:hypothetical protein